MDAIVLYFVSNIHRITMNENKAWTFFDGRQDNEPPTSLVISRHPENMPAGMFLTDDICIL